MRFSFFVYFLLLMIYVGTSFAQNETDSLGNQRKSFRVWIISGILAVLQ